MVWQDAFDNYNSFNDAVGGGWRCSNESTTNDFSTNSAGACQIIPGYSGKAIRLVYDGRANSDGQEGHAWSHALADAAAGTQGKAIYVSYYFRITPGGGIQLDASPANRVQVKWLMLWGASDRAQFSTAYSYCTNGLPQTMWNFYARGAGAGTCQGGQVRAPFAKDGTGQWHRATHRYVTQSSPGARDGSAQMWVDGTLILSVAKGYCGVAVPQNAGTKAQNWCENADLDSFSTNDAVRKLTLGSVSTSSLWAFTLDWDNMTVWRDR